MTAHANRTGAGRPVAARVAAGAHLTLHYRLTLLPECVDLVNTFDGKPATLQMGIGQLAEPLEALLLGLEEGSDASFDVPAGQAYGERNPALIQRVSRRALAAASEAADALGEGDVIEMVSADGRRVAGRILSLADDHATLDFNHPLAGKSLRFDVALIGVLA